MGEVIDFRTGRKRAAKKPATIELVDVGITDALPIIERAKDVFGLAIGQAQEDTGMDVAIDHEHTGHWQVVGLSGQEKGDA